jgi:hypothetical protein
MMDRKKAEQGKITIYWWNFNTKTLDHKGTYEEFSKKKSIKIRPVKHPSIKGYVGFRAKIPVGSAIITYDDFSYNYPKLIDKFQFEQAYQHFLDNAIIIFLTYLGDKTTYISRWSDKKINWR